MEMQKSVTHANKTLKINMWKIKNITKLEITAIIQGNIEVPCIAYEIQNIVYIKEFLLLFIMDLTIIIIYCKRVSRSI